VGTLDSARGTVALCYALAVGHFFQKNQFFQKFSFFPRFSEIFIFFQKFQLFSLFSFFWKNIFFSKIFTSAWHCNLGLPCCAVGVLAFGLRSQPQPGVFFKGVGIWSEFSFLQNLVCPKEVSRAQKIGGQKHFEKCSGPNTILRKNSKQAR
jgi:hypothetical protein